jgi:antitoxin MazE
MKTRIIRIGNSRGIRIPKPLLDEAGLEGEVEISLKNKSLVIRPAKKKPREGWAESAVEMAKHGDEHVWEEGDVLTNSWDEEEWEW